MVLDQVETLVLLLGLLYGFADVVGDADWKSPKSSFKVSLRGVLAGRGMEVVKAGAGNGLREDAILGGTDVGGSGGKPADRPGPPGVLCRRAFSLFTAAVNGFQLFRFFMTSDSSMYLPDEVTVWPAFLTIFSPCSKILS